MDKLKTYHFWKSFCDYWIIIIRILHHSLLQLDVISWLCSEISEKSIKMLIIFTNILICSCHQIKFIPIVSPETKIQNKLLIKLHQLTLNLRFPRSLILSPNPQHNFSFKSLWEFRLKSIWLIGPNTMLQHIHEKFEYWGSRSFIASDSINPAW